MQLGGDNNRSGDTATDYVSCRIVSYRARKSAKVTNSSDHAALVSFHFERSACLSLSLSRPFFFSYLSPLFLLSPVESLIPSASVCPHPPSLSLPFVLFVLRSSPLSYGEYLRQTVTPRMRHDEVTPCFGPWYFISDIIIPASATLVRIYRPAETLPSSFRNRRIFALRENVAALVVRPLVKANACIFDLHRSVKLRRTTRFHVLFSFNTLRVFSSVLNFTFCQR